MNGRNKPIAVIFLLLSFLCLATKGNAQYDLSIKVLDSNRVGIGSASVSLLSTADSSILAYGYTNTDGIAVLKNIQSGTYLLYANVAGLEEKYAPLLLQNKALQVEVSLNKSGKILQEVIVQSHRPIEIHGDTTTYDVHRFLRGNESTVEDMLKRLPGVEVDDKGNLTFKGKEVEKVMIEGDDFFEKGYKLLTKNMPTKPVEKVDAIEDFHSNALLKGFENSNKVALNLKLSDKVKSQWFGNADVAGDIATGKYYDVKSNLMNFKKKTKYYFLATGNNTGADAVGDASFSPNSSNTDVSAAALINFNQSQNEFSQQRTNFNNTKLMSLNAIFHPSNKLKIKPLIYGNWDTKKYYETNIDSFLTQGQTFTNIASNQLKNRQFQGLAKVDIEFDPNQHENINGFLSYNNLNNHYWNANIFNGDPISERLQSRSKKLLGHIVYTNKLSDKNLLQFSGNYASHRLPQTYTTDSYLLSQFLDSVNEDTRQYISNRLSQGNFDFQWSHKFNANSFFKSSLNGLFSRESISSMLIGDSTNMKNDIYKNDFIFRRQYLTWKNEFSKQIDHFQLNMNSVFQFSEIDNKVKTHWFNWNPNANVSYQVKKSRIGLMAGYQTIGIDPMNGISNYYLTNYRSFARGLSSMGNLKMLNSYNYGLDYFYGNITDRFFGFLKLSYDDYRHYLSNYSNINRNFTQTSDTILNGRNNWMLLSNMQYYVSSLSTRFKGNIQLSGSSYHDLLNSAITRNIRSHFLQLKGEANTAFSGIFNFQLGVEFDQNHFKIDQLSNNVNTNYKYFFYSFFNINDRLDFQLNGDGYYFTNLSTNRNYNFMDLIGRYKIKGEKLNISLDARNLMNLRTFRRASISSLYSSIYFYRLQPRMLMLRVQYQF